MISKFALCLAVAAALAAPAFAQTPPETASQLKQQIVDVTSKEEIVNRWQQQFAGLNSLAFTAKVDSTVTIDDDKDGEPLSYSVNFVGDGAKFFSEMNIVSGVGPTSYFASAYDGQLYETSIKAGGLNVVTKGSKTNEDLSFGGISNPWLLQYAFVLGDDESNLDALRKPEVWSRLLSNIREVTPAEREGHKGSMLTINSPDGDQFYKVFVESYMAWPSYWASFDKDKPSQVDSELTASNFSVIFVDGQFFAFPLSLNAKQSPEDGKTPNLVSFVTDVHTLKINRPVAQVFSFPITSKTLVQDMDKPDEK